MPGNLMEVSTETSTFLKSCFSKTLANPARQSLRKVDHGHTQGGRYKVPKTRQSREGKCIKGYKGGRWYSGKVTDLGANSTSLEDTGWYPTLLGTFPVRLPHSSDLMLSVTATSTPEVEPQLAAWPISGDSMKTNKFLTKAQSCYWHHGEQSPQSHMTHSSGNGYAGITRGILIPFRDL